MIYFIFSAIIVLVALLTVLALIVSQRIEQRARAAQVIGSTANTKNRKNSDKDFNKRRAELAKKLNESSEKESKNRASFIRQRMREAGLNADLRRYWLVSVIFALVASGTIFAAGLSTPVAIMAGIVGFFGLPRLLLRVMAQRRQKKFLEEFPDALEAIVRLLKSGMPVSEAIAMVGREYSGPVGEEMAYIHDQQRVGISLPDAVLSAAKRMPLTEMQMFATGVAIQQQTGASLSETLQNLASVIRARHRLKRKVAALSAEAKASAIIIGSLPVVVGGGLYAINPEYMGVMFNTSIGNMYLAGAVVWMCVGILIMRQMINFKV